MRTNAAGLMKHDRGLEGIPHVEEGFLVAHSGTDAVPLWQERREEDFRAIVEIRGPRASDTVLRHRLGRDVDGEGGIVFRHALPDFLDGAELLVRKAGVCIRAVGRHGDAREFVVRDESTGRGQRLPDEVQIDGLVSAGIAVELEGLCQRRGSIASPWHVRRRDGFAGHGRVRLCPGGGCPADGNRRRRWRFPVEPACLSDTQRTIAQEQLAQLHRGLAIEGGHAGEAAPQGRYRCGAGCCSGRDGQPRERLHGIGLRLDCREQQQQSSSSHETHGAANMTGDHDPLLHGHLR